MQVASTNPTQNQITNWFNETISHLEGDKFSMEEGIASAETQKMYNDLINGDLAETMGRIRSEYGVYFQKSLVIDFIELLRESRILPKELAFDFVDSKVLVWAVIADDDERTEDNLITIEAKVNAKYYSKEVGMGMTIVEEGDRLITPSHYMPLSMNKLAKNSGGIQ